MKRMLLATAALAVIGFTGAAGAQEKVFALVPKALGVPFVALRAVSDLCGPAAGQQFHLELDQVAETSARAVEALAGAVTRS